MSAAKRKRAPAKDKGGKRASAKPRSTLKRGAPKRAASARKSAPRAAKRPQPKRAAKPAGTAPPLAHQGARVELGQAVAPFALPATGGGHWRLQDARGRKLLVYFYPRDNTPGCTLEGQQFSALAQRFDQAGITIVGISRDSLAAHESFRSKMGFPFQLLSDSSGAVCAQFDVWREKNMYGRKVLGIERSSFLIDANGVLQREWRKVRVDGHALAVLEAAQAL